jgi:hypothetical protein
MGKPLSVDLRSPLVASVTPAMSRRGAAEPFGVCRHRRALAASRQHDGHHCGQTAGRRHTFAPHRSIQRRDPAAVAVLKDIRRVELAALPAERAWCFFLDQHGLALPHRHGMTFKKNRARSRAGAT